MRQMNHDKVIYLLDECRGIYIPQAFAERFGNREETVKGIDQKDWDILDAGPDHEFYWEAWDEVERHAKVYLDGPNSPHYWTVHNDGGCFLVRDDVEWCHDCNGWMDADCGCPHVHDEEIND